jgi:hypothetical protein
MNDPLAPRSLRKYAKAIRSGRRGSDRIVTFGKIVCDSCGHMLPVAQVAERIGVTSKQLSAFLNHQTVRTDVAQTIRDAVMEVDE